jgi:glycolate oxidase iron-sulfur subunit
MQHRIPAASLGPAGEGMALAVARCVHCGFCLPTCPTYRVLGEEMDSPRGRIVLMKQALEGELSIPDVLPHIDRCLGCLACVTACPSGVSYGDLLTPFRAKAEAEARTPFARLRQRGLVRLLESPALFRLAVRAGQIASGVSAMLPRSARRSIALLPSRLDPPATLPTIVPAQGTRRARVALLAGCAQQVLAPDINLATIRVLAAHGIEVVVPAGQACCGALAMHGGQADHARARARALLGVMPADVDAIVTNAAGCGSAMKEYGALLAGTPDAGRAEAFAARVRDVSELLDQIGLVRPLALSSPMTVAYHDACHLAHAQKVKAPPRRLLSAVRNLTVRDVPDAEICCGSAGLYNLTQPDIAETLGAAKAAAVVSTGAEAVVTGNIGCMTQLEVHLRRAGRTVPVLHTMQVLDRAMRA